MGNQRTTQIKTTEANNQRKASVATQPPLSINSPVHPILQLQQQLGNQAVNRLIQTKMTVGQPGDTYEQEADQVAATVMRTPAPQVQRQTEEEEVQTKPITPLVQRQMEEEEEVQTKAITPLAQRQMEEEEEVQTKPITPLVQRQMEEEEEVQTKAITPLAQRQMEEEEEVQTKAITPLAQRQMEEEEEVQTKPITPLVQRQMEEEEEVQAKPITPLVQRQMEEEEEVQAKPITPLVQRQMEEEEEVQAKPITPLVQRQMEEEEENEKVQMLQRQTDEEEEKVQTKAAPGQTPNVSANLEARIQSARGSGQPLSDSTRAFMEPRFGYDFSNVRVHTDDRAASAARDLNAQAFTVGQDIFFGSGRYAPESTVGKRLFAHELVHTLQQQPKSPSAFVAEPSDPEQAPTALEPSLPPLSSEEAGGNKSLDTKTEPEPKTDGGKNDVASQESVETKVEDTEPSLKSTAEESESDVALELEKPSAIGEEEVAEVSSLSLEGASDQALSKFMESSPSEIAATQPNLGTQLDSNLKQEQQAEVENAPTLVAKTSGTVEEGVKAPEQISAGGAEISDGVTQTDPGELKASPPENLGTLPNNKEKEKLVDRQDDNSFLGWFRNNIKGFLTSISTDAGVNTNAGERENVELKGEADPQRMANQQSDAESQLKAQRDMTANTFKQHPGQQNIQPKEVNEEKTAQLSSEAFVSIETPADTGAMDYVNAPLPPDVRNHADKLLKPTLDANLAEAKTQTQDAVKTRDRDKAAKINQAKLDAVAVNQKADKDQRDIVVANRQEVARQQQEGIEDSYDQVNEFITEADQEQIANRKEIGDQVEKSEGEADKELEKGEEKAEKEKEASEKKAADKKKELEKSQEKDSWWDRAVSAVKSAVKAITSAIDTIFTALRDAVKTIIEKAKNAAVALINKARNWVIDKLNKFRDWAKNQVNKYLKDRFPNLAKRINDGIDSVVDTAIEGVNVVADAAIAGVEAVADGLAAALDKVLQVFQTALKAAVQIAGAVITGDFAEALRVAVQAACDIAGIDSKPIFDFIDRAAGQVMAILKDPKTFFNNVMEAIGGGVSNFAKNIQQHLIKGLIGWLTGALSEVNLSLPETFDAKGILSLVMQILGLTYENIKAKVIKKFPPAAQVIDGVEKGIEIVQKLVNEGPVALWEEVKQSFSNLKETVISGIQDFVIKTVVKEGIAWLLGLLTPAGAIAKLLKLIFDFVMFLVERFQQIKDFVMSVYNSITAIASGNLSQAKQAVEDALSRSLPVVISLLASLAGLGGIGKTVKNIIGKVAKPVNKIVDKLIDRMVKFAKKLLKKGKAVAKKVKEKLFQWWKIDKKFKDKSGNEHRLFFKGKGSTSMLMVASDVQHFENFIKSVEVTSEEAKAAKTQAIAIAKQIDNRKRDSVKGANDAETKKNEEKKAQDLETLVVQLSGHAKLLFGLSDTELPESKLKFSSFTKEGAELGDVMTAEVLTKKGKSGSVPTSEKHTIFDRLLKRRDGGRSYYIRGHLLNHHIHGPGKWNNLTPLSKAGNKAHLREAENTVKAAVQSGAIVKYTVKAVYGRSVSVPTDEELKSKGIDDSKWQDLKSIRAAESYVPQSLTLSAWLLEKQESGTYKDKQPIVSQKSVINPVDTNLGNYEVGEGKKKKEKVILTVDNIDKIAENTGVSNTDIRSIQDLAISVQNLHKYNQIVEKIEASDISDARKRKLKGIVNQLQAANNVVLR
ncbi:DUF4157 domain-containing protein [Okeania sp. SIO2B9]|uniref:eCIS core domain-containing protein n=1 Tax=Okeania sp. SIO2B9 TaxID=2607782 RepID=UPI00142B2E15|nr:DUF4157 domain-containing protein [Okeania sp. SIO2B9]NES88031.1 DUF4157 domain-containing protein [Okeania sp. SIO2B9]